MHTVTITWTPDTTPDTDTLFALCADHGAAASLEPDDGRAHITLTIDDTDDMAAAMQAAVDYVAGHVPGRVDAVEVMTVAEHDRRLAEPAFPDLVGVAEVAEILGVNRQRASAVQTRRDFPAPIARLRSGPVWRRRDISRFEAEWDRKPGRPRKVPSAT